jgi:hypothetical protein
MSIKLLKRLSCGIISGVCCCLFCLLLATAASADVCFLPTGQCEAASANLSTGCSGFNLTGAKDETGWNCTQCGEKWKCEKKSCKDDYKTDVRCSGTETKVCDETRKAGDESCCKCEDSVTKCQHEGYVYKTTNTNENCTGKCPYNSDYYESCECNAKYDKSSNTNACYTYNTCELGDLAGTKKYEQASDAHKCKAYIDNSAYVTDNSEQVKSDDYDCTLVCTETCDNSNRKYYQCSPKSGCHYNTVAQCKAAGYTYTAAERWEIEESANPGTTGECEPCDCGGTEMNKCTLYTSCAGYEYKQSQVSNGALKTFPERYEECVQTVTLDTYYKCAHGYSWSYAGSGQYQCVANMVTCTIDPDDPDVFDPGYWQLDNISCDNGTTKATPGAVTLRYTSDSGCHTTVDVKVGKGSTMSRALLSTASGSCSGIGCTIRHGGNSWCSQVKNTCSIFGSEFSKDSTGYYVTENGQKIYWKVDGSENYTGDCSAGGGCESQYKSQCDSWGGTLKSSTSYVNEDVCHAVFGECDNKYWYCLKPGCSDSGSVTVYYDAPTNCNAPMRLTHQSSGVTIMTAATTNNVPAGTYTISPSSGSIQSYTIRMGRGGTPSTKTGTTTYTFSAGNEYWIVPNCSSGGGCQNNSDCHGRSHTACGIRWTACMEMTSNAYSYCMGQAGQSSMMQGACSGMYAANKATCNNYKNYECMICQSGACLPDPVEPNWSSRLQHYSN